MNYTNQSADSPYQIHAGEAFSAYVARMEDACDGSFLADYAADHPDVVDTLGEAESDDLAAAIKAEMSDDEFDALIMSPDYMSQTEGLDDDSEFDEAGVLPLAIDDPLTRAEIMGLAEMYAPGVLERVAARLRSA